MADKVKKYFKQWGRAQAKAKALGLGGPKGSGITSPAGLKRAKRAVKAKAKATKQVAKAEEIIRKSEARYVKARAKAKAKAKAPKPATKKAAKTKPVKAANQIKGAKPGVTKIRGVSKPNFTQRPTTPRASKITQPLPMFRVTK